MYFCFGVNFFELYLFLDPFVYIHYIKCLCVLTFPLSVLYFLSTSLFASNHFPTTQFFVLFVSLWVWLGLSLRLIVIFPTQPMTLIAYSFPFRFIILSKDLLSYLQTILDLTNLLSNLNSHFFLTLIWKGTSSREVFLLFHILTNTSCHLCFWS